VCEARNRNCHHETTGSGCCPAIITGSGWATHLIALPSCVCTASIGPQNINFCILDSRFLASTDAVLGMLGKTNTPEPLPVLQVARVNRDAQLLCVVNGKCAAAQLVLCIVVFKGSIRRWRSRNP
jgi:hypothetical protein